ncbi:hypothetical protein EKO04_006788 [Ascochyta lentis]|uniref:Uncharacterized protein n=1 Tax=Ascochyta lentis TaxID=205686 RepID=A0A8H7J249_9PLEO|nr:hypothetical protein EKO04_006788 [Ascochyta lentis]
MSFLDSGQDDELNDLRRANDELTSKNDRLTEQVANLKKQLKEKTDSVRSKNDELKRLAQFQSVYEKLEAEARKAAPDDAAALKLLTDPDQLWLTSVFDYASSTSSTPTTRCFRNAQTHLLMQCILHAEESKANILAFRTEVQTFLDTNAGSITRDYFDQLDNFSKQVLAFDADGLTTTHMQSLAQLVHQLPTMDDTLDIFLHIRQQISELQHIESALQELTATSNDVGDTKLYKKSDLKCVSLVVDRYKKSVGPEHMEDLRDKLHTLMEAAQNSILASDKKLPIDTRRWLKAHIEEIAEYAIRHAKVEELDDIEAGNFTLTEPMKVYEALFKRPLKTDVSKELPDSSRAPYYNQNESELCVYRSQVRPLGSGLVGIRIHDYPPVDCNKKQEAGSVDSESPDVDEGQGFGASSVRTDTPSQYRASAVSEDYNEDAGLRFGQKRTATQAELHDDAPTKLQRSERVDAAAITSRPQPHFMRYDIDVDSASQACKQETPPRSTTMQTLSLPKVRETRGFEDAEPPLLPKKTLEPSKDIPLASTPTIQPAYIPYDEEEIMSEQEGESDVY